VKFDHVTIRTTQLMQTRDFFVDVFELSEGPRPQALQRIPGYWLYADGEPIVHLVASGKRDEGSDGASDAIDHVAFRLDDHAAFSARLARLGVSHSSMELEELGERRIFLRAPGGPRMEVVFREAPGAGSA
jgi:catechol 2,3-dioxygenase-like lactoylglutathione lyase family enzyme